MSTKISERERRRAETRLRYEQSQRAKAVRAAYKKERASNRVVSKQNKPFVVWDGEQPQDTGYSLFGNSEGAEICHPWLTTAECLDLILDAEKACPEAIHVWFGGNFDASWIIRDLSWRQKNRLKKFNYTWWRGYRIEHVPRKWFKVIKDGYSVTIYEIHSFFNTTLTGALEKWKIGPFAETTGSNAKCATVPSADALRQMSEPAIVRVFKDLRSQFTWKNMESIRIYMRLELKYSVVLMEKLREAFIAAGYLPDSWHGPGALARMAFKRNNVYAGMAECPKEVQDAARHAFIGGRFTTHWLGYIQQFVYSLDRNSAYPYACTFLPNLNKGKWKLEIDPAKIRDALDRNRFAVFLINYHDKSTDVERDSFFRIYPLPRRSPDGVVAWPYKVKGWYWSPEANLVKNDESAEYIAAWVFYESCPEDRPFAWMYDYYRKRKLLQQTGQAAEYTFKIIMNAVFGQLAQRVGWDKKNNRAPVSHQLEFAGYITSHCRAAIQVMAARVGHENVVSIDTDGLLTLKPVPLKPDEAGDALGQWKTEEFDAAIVWQSGMYGLRRNGEWNKAKTRGMPRGAYNPEDLVKTLIAEHWRVTWLNACGNKGLRKVHPRTGHVIVHPFRPEPKLELKRHKFIGYGLALNGQYEKDNVWVDDPVVFRMAPTAGQVHSRIGCGKWCRGTMHRVANGYMGVFSPVDIMSHPHYLPWKENGDEYTVNKRIIDDQTLYDSWEPDKEERWVR